MAKAPGFADVKSRLQPPLTGDEARALATAFLLDRLDGVVALSGGYTREEANQRLARNHGMSASFSRALAEGLTAQQSDREFNDALDKSIGSIYQASIT